MPRINDLINGGDWACAWVHHGGLASVCNELAAILEPPFAKRVLGIAEQARIDMRAASREWAQLAEELRTGPPEAYLHDQADRSPTQPGRIIV